MAKINSSLNEWLTGSKTTSMDSHLTDMWAKSYMRDTLGGNSASVTSGAGVLLVSGTGSYIKARTIELRPVGGDIYVADDSGVSSSNGVLVKDGEVYTLEDYMGAVYAIAVGATATVRYGLNYRA